jgi:SAM-dependent methyltransferase
VLLRRPTAFELAYLCAGPFVLPLHQTVRRRLIQLARTYPGARILDVGGRKSHYTVGVPGRLVVTDVPRATALQRQLNLGVTDAICGQVRARRSNIEAVLLDDMTRSSLPDAAFDIVVAVEVLEHVEDDEAFVRHVRRVLRPGGTFLMTTPNGDAVPNSNPDHKRHYTRASLGDLLVRHFDAVTVEYAVAGGRFRRLGLRPWSLSRPWFSAVGMVANLVNAVQSARPSIGRRAQGTRHLIATARRASNGAVPCAR